MRPQLFLSLMVFVLVCVSTSVAQPVTMEQINTFLSQFDPVDIPAVRRSKKITSQGPQIFGEQVSVHYFEDNGRLARILASKHPITIPLEPTPEETAERFLKDYSQQIGIKPDLSELVARPSKHQGRENYYDQYYQGHPVRSGTLGISLNVDNQLSRFSSLLIPITEERPTTFAIDREAAIERMFEKFCLLNECDEENYRIKTKQFIRVEDGVPFATWEITANPRVVPPYWIAWIDGETGEFVAAYKGRNH